MRGDPEVIQRILASYRLMLDFYGMRLVSEDTGLVDRASVPRNYAHRYRNLVRAYARSTCKRYRSADTSPRLRTQLSSHFPHPKVPL